MTLGRLIWAAGVWACLLAEGWAQGPEFVAPAFTPVAWLPTAEAALVKNKTAAVGISLADSGARHHKSDTVTILAQLSNPEGRIRQWAVELKVNGIKPEEEKLRTAPIAIYLNTGLKVEFPPEPVEGIAIHVLGPFSSDRGAKGAKDVWSGTLVHPGFLSLGLDQSAAALTRLTHLMQNDPVFQGKQIKFSFGGAPFPPEEIAAQREWFDRFAMTPEEARAYAGMGPALATFFQIASQTPGLKEIVFEVVDVPWLSVAAHGGDTQPSFNFAGAIEPLQPADWGLPPEMKVWALAMQLTLRGKPALNCRFAFTTPRPPMFNSAGIVGVAAVRPDGKGSRFALRVMAGHCAATPP